MKGEKVSLKEWIMSDQQAFYETVQREEEWNDERNRTGTPTETIPGAPHKQATETDEGADGSGKG
jgi:hypothetical protein